MNKTIESWTDHKNINKEKKNQMLSIMGLMHSIYSTYAIFSPENEEEFKLTTGQPKGFIPHDHKTQTKNHYLSKKYSLISSFRLPINWWTKSNEPYLEI